MYYVILGIHLLIALLLGVVVLLQRSKGNGLAGAFGGVGAGEAMFGTHGVTTMLHKATIYLAIAFMLTSLGLVYLTAHRSEHPTTPTRAAGSRPVLPVGGGDVAAPEVPTTTAPAATDDVVPAGTEDSIVPDAVEPVQENAGEAAGSPDTEEGETGSGGR